MTIPRTVLLVLLASALWAQPSRREVTNPSSNQVDDTKPNSTSVPEVYAITTQFDRVLIFRFKYDTDLLAGIEKMVKQEKIRNAVFLSGIGSVRGYQIHQVSNRTLPSKNMFVKDPTMPADVTSVNGYVMDGRVHAHITLANPEGAFAGHLEPGTTAFTFVAITVGVLKDGVDISRLDDKGYR